MNSFLHFHNLRASGQSYYFNCDLFHFCLCYSYMCNTIIKCMYCKNMSMYHSGLSHKPWCGCMHSISQDQQAYVCDQSPSCFKFLVSLFALKEVTL